MTINLTVPGKKPPQAVMLIIPVLWLISLVVLSYFSVKAGYAKIKSQRDQIASAKKMENILSEKESTLRAISSEISKYVTPISIALPDKNPALFLISQIKNLSAQNSTNLADFKIGGGSEGVEPKVSLAYGLTGSYYNILSFLQASEKIAPIVSLQKIEMSLVSDTASAEIGMNSYWSEYPDKIPSVTDPIAKLSSSNYETLNKVVGFTPPIFTTLPAMGPSGRQNPFF